MTCESTLKKDPESLFALLFSEEIPNRDNYFLRQGPGTFPDNSKLFALWVLSAIRSNSS